MLSQFVLTHIRTHFTHSFSHTLTHALISTRNHTHTHTCTQSLKTDDKRCVVVICECNYVWDFLFPSSPSIKRLSGNLLHPSPMFVCLPITRSFSLSLSLSLIFLYAPILPTHIHTHTRKLHPIES